MSDPNSLFEAMEREKVRHLNEAENIAHEMAILAEAERIKAKYGRVVSATNTEPTTKQLALEVPPEPQVSHTGETLASLARHYRTDPRSPYHKVRHQTRRNYQRVIDRLCRECGSVNLGTWKQVDIERQYEQWKSTGKESMTHSLITMLRVLINFGDVTLKDEDCARLALVLHRMEFPVPQVQRAGRLTAAQVDGIRNRAIANATPSIALAQALQFDCNLNQKDVIGEWVPIKEPGTSDFIDGDDKWVRGLRWSEIDAKMILRRPAAPGLRAIDVDLNLAPRVMEEIAAIPPERRVGPVVICEGTEKPWRTSAFRRAWRKFADECGIPKSVKNTDSRARQPTRWSMREAAE